MRTIWILAVAVFLGTSGCGSTSQSTGSDTARSTEELEALYRARQQRDLTRFTEADVDFMTGMIGHHAQALIMARMAPENGEGSAVKTLAARIINAQNDEIATMQRWLEDRGQSVPEVHIDGLNLMLHGAGDHTHMPGMLSQEQLVELSEARGLEFDRLFLTYMIQHHEGATTMVKDLFDAGGGGRDEATFKLASDINVDQITEIARMKQMLAALEESSQP